MRVELLLLQEVGGGYSVVVWVWAAIFIAGAGRGAAIGEVEVDTVSGVGGVSLD